MLFENVKNFDIVTEAYVGKTPSLINAEKELEKIIQIVRGSFNLDLKAIDPVNSSSAAKKFNQFLSDEFGTKILVNFSAIPIGGTGNAYTPVNSTPLNSLSIYKDFKKTGKIKSPNRLLPIFVTIDINLIVKHNYTAEEVMGIILHEIGHNLRHVIILTTLNPIEIFITRPIMATALGATDRVLSVAGQLPIISQIIKFRDIVDNLVDDITGGRIETYKQFYRLFIKQSTVLIKGANPLNYLGGYASERNSDSLATAYGYGSALSSALLKLEDSTRDSTFNRAIRKNGILSFGDNLVIGAIEIARTFALQGVHPQTAHRIKNTLNKLEKDLRTGAYPPEVKKQLESDVKEMRELYEAYLNADSQNKDKSTQLYRQYVERFGVDPLRNLVLDKVYQMFEV